VLFGLRCNILKAFPCILQEQGEGSLNTTSSGLVTGMKDDGAMMAYQADAEGEGSGSDPAGTCPPSLYRAVPDLLPCETSEAL
jgi:hypothetical protein